VSVGRILSVTFLSRAALPQRTILAKRVGVSLSWNVNECCFVVSNIGAQRGDPLLTCRISCVSTSMLTDFPATDSGSPTPATSLSALFALFALFVCPQNTPLFLLPCVSTECVCVCASGVFFTLGGFHLEPRHGEKENTIGTLANNLEIEKKQN